MPQVSNRDKAQQVIEQIDEQWRDFRELRKSAELSMCEMRVFLAEAVKKKKLVHRRLQLKNGNKICEYKRR